MNINDNHAEQHHHLEQLESIARDTSQHAADHHAYELLKTGALRCWAFDMWLTIQREAAYESGREEGRDNGLADGYDSGYEAGVDAAKAEAEDDAHQAHLDRH